MKCISFREILLLVGIFGFFCFISWKVLLCVLFAFLKILYFSNCSLQMTRRWSLDVSVLLKHLALMRVRFNLIIQCYCFRQIFGMNSLLFSHVVMWAALCWKTALLMKMFLIAQKSTRCLLSSIISNTTSKTSNAVVTGMLFDLFSYFSVPVPVKNTSDLFLSSLRTVPTSL